LQFCDLADSTQQIFRIGAEPYTAFNDLLRHLAAAERELFVLSGRPLGQSLASLPLDERAERYRQFAAQAVLKAQAQTDTERKAEYMTLATGWHTMAQEAERFLGHAIPGEAAISDSGDLAEPPKSSPA